MSSSVTVARSEFRRLIVQRREEVLTAWVKEQLRDGRAESLPPDELRAQGDEFLTLIADPADGDSIFDANSAAWRPARAFLADLSRTRARQGFSPSETASFVFALKRPLFAMLRTEFADDAAQLGEEIWNATELLDQLGLLTMEEYQRGREEVIRRQQLEMLELSTPVVTLWDGVLALPMIGTLDSARTQIVMETLLQRIVETGAAIAIIDITGVPTVDTMTAQHLLKTVTATRLMGAECIISGIRPQIAQTIVHLGVDLGDVTTKATLADAFRVALSRTGRRVTGAVPADDRR
ncbi:MAG TPA: STAS domain-containing protein [Gemmatimonadaceae bacterium]|nr:STAS domain-containing protein [Gemmatimonadaceae bacterium]